MSSDYAELHSGTRALQARGLSKTYAIFDRSLDRIKQALTFGWKRYARPFVALDSIDLDVAPGEMVGIVGRNGSGKSTLLQLIAGTLAPTAGEVAVGGRVAALLELGSGFHPEAPGRENIYLNAAILGLRRSEIEARFDQIVEFAEIGNFIDQPVKTYSSGMVIRLAFAVAVHVDANILIVDEALAVGDAAFQAKCYRRIAELRQRGITILLASHDMNAIATMCDRAVLLEHGKVALAGPAKLVAEEYYRSVRTLPARTTTSTRASEPLHGLEAPVLQHGSQMGDGSAEIIGYAIRDADDQPTRSLESRGRCRFDVGVRFEADLENPQIGVALRDPQGTILLGTHTLFDQASPGPVQAGQQLLLTFRTQVNLRPGRYLLMIGVAEHSSPEHWRDCDVYFDLCEVEVFGAGSWGLISVESAIEIQPLPSAEVEETPRRG